MATPAIVARAPAPAVASRYAPTTFAANTWTTGQLADIRNAVNASLGGIGGGETLGQITGITTSSLQKTGDFTAAQIAAIGTAAAWDSHGSSFREQGNSAAPYFAAEYGAIMANFKGAYGDPHTAVQQPPVAPPVAPALSIFGPTTRVTLPVARVPAPAVIVAATPQVTIAAPPAAISAPAGAGITSSADAGLTAAISALTAATAAFKAAPAVAAAAVPAGPTTAELLASFIAAVTPAAATQAAAATTPTTTTATTATSADALAGSILGQAQNANAAGSGSVAGGVGYADTSGITPLQATTSTTSGVSGALVAAVVGLCAIGGLFVWLHFRGHHHANPPAAAA